MSVKRRELIRYLEENGFRLLREGGQTLRLYEYSEDNSDQAAPGDRSYNRECLVQAGGVTAEVLGG